MTCGFGIRIRKRICMRIHPNKRRSVQVPESYCSNVRDIVPQSKTKTCKRTCEEPSWVISPWSDVSIFINKNNALPLHTLIGISLLAHATLRIL